MGNKLMIIEGDCIEVMKHFDENEFDAIVCDPPYGLEFMGKKWDKLWDKRNKDDQDNEGIKTFLRAGKNLTAYKAGISMQLWHTQWLTEAYRVLKPGGSMLVMGGTRTSHRLACAIEDSGFIIKDTLMWIYGSGFPKAQDLGKMIDKRAGKERKVVGEVTRIGDKKPYKQNQEEGFLGYEGNATTIPSTDLGKHWDGFKVGGIKPAYEPIIWAVKPPEGSYIDNVLKHGVGAVNVDECRIGTVDNLKGGTYGGVFSGTRDKNGNLCKAIGSGNKGRFPANIILSHHPECVQVGMKRVKGAWSNKGVVKHKKIFNADLGKNKLVNKDRYYDKDGFETVESWDCHPDCAVRLLDEQSGVLKSGARRGQLSKPATNVYGEYKGKPLNCESSSGGASRFFYCAKASRGERNVGLEGVKKKQVSNGRDKLTDIAFQRGKTWRTNTHPTVKPIKLFEYLIKLVTREGQVILDPFLGSGTTMIAANNVNRICVGIEKEKEYCKIAKRRVCYWEKK